MKRQGRIRVWAVQRDEAHIGMPWSRHPCIFGSRSAAYENCDPDEVVVQIEYRVLRTIRPRVPRRRQ